VRRSASGAGAYLDVAAADGILGLMALMVDETLATCEQQGPGTNLLLGRYACYDIYETRDGGWLSVAAIEPKFWANFCRLLDLDRGGQRVVPMFRARPRAARVGDGRALRADR
jgi:alpha-methylacyl-CoA racemase